MGIFKRNKVKAPKTKKFNGKQYKLKGTFKNKKGLNKRKRYYNTTPSKTNPVSRHMSIRSTKVKGGYAIYTRDKNINKPHR